MTKQQLFNAVNELSKQSNFPGYIYVKNIMDVNIQVPGLAAYLWLNNFSDNENTQLLKQYLNDANFKFDE